MTTTYRNLLGLAVVLAAAGLSGCTTTGPYGTGSAAPEDIQPLPSSTVESQALPPIGANGSATQQAQAGSGAMTTASAGATMNPDGTMTPAGTMNPDGTMQTGSLDGTSGGAQGMATDGSGTTANGQIGDTASTDGSFVTLNDVGAVPNTSGRDLSAPLTAQKLIGGWTVISGSDQCRLYLSLTSKVNTNRYTARAPGCTMQNLAMVASWQLAGSQVQLFNENGDIIAALLLSGNRFVGTLVGGQSISMAG
jgi:Protease inhibitor Inh